MPAAAKTVMPPQGLSITHPVAHLTRTITHTHRWQQPHRHSQATPNNTTYGSDCSWLRPSTNQVAGKSTSSAASKVSVQSRHSWPISWVSCLVSHSKPATFPVSRLAATPARNWPGLMRNCGVVQLAAHSPMVI